MTSDVLESCVGGQSTPRRRMQVSSCSVHVLVSEVGVRSLQDMGRNCSDCCWVIYPWQCCRIYLGGMAPIGLIQAISLYCRLPMLLAWHLINLIESFPPSNNNVDNGCDDESRTLYKERKVLPITYYSLYGCG